MENRDTESQALTVVPRQDLAACSPMEALAQMSDAEFDARLAALKKAQTRMARIQREMMHEGVDYGVIPGTGDKPTMLKPGSEILCKFHHLVPALDPRVTLGDGVTTPHIRVITICSLHAGSEDGPIVAQGVGASNSWEKKYRWRTAQRACPQCGATAIIKGKAEWGGGWVCYKAKGGCGAKFKDGDQSIEGQQLGQIENPDPFDMENTLLKMSAKRAQVDATLRATATSGLFTQDLEDLVPEPVKKSEAPKATPPPQPTPVNEDEAPDDDYAPAEDVPPPPAKQSTHDLAWDRYLALTERARAWNTEHPDRRVSFGMVDGLATTGEIVSAGKALKARLEEAQAAVAV